MKYIDIHTHNAASTACTAVVNIMPGEKPEEKEGIFFSTGIHPWYIERYDIDKTLQQIEKLLVHKDFIALGETGLDKYAVVPLPVQKTVFLRHTELSGKYDKPLIIHCVGFYNELIKIKKGFKKETAWIIHGFNTNIQIAKELLKHGFYFSFGKALTVPGSNAGKTIKTVPTERLFLETDDSGIDIKTIYSAAAGLLGTNEQVLCKIISNNFNKIFKKR